MLLQSPTWFLSSSRRGLSVHTYDDNRKHERIIFPFRVEGKQLKTFGSKRVTANNTFAQKSGITNKNTSTEELSPKFEGGNVMAKNIENDTVVSKPSLANEGSELSKPLAQMKPIFSFGVITDVQYADIDDGFSFSGVPRFYRHSLEVLRRAVDCWNAGGELSFVIHFGDIVDGFCPKDQSRTAIDRVMSEFRRFTGGRVYHMLGNHCLYNLPRQELNELLEIPSGPDQRSFYDFSPHKGFRFIILDGYDVSLLGWPQDHPHTIKAFEILEENNPNDDKNSPSGLIGAARRFVKFGGGVGNQQWEWLDSTLHDADIAKEKVIICSHIPMDIDAVTYKPSLMWNYSEVMEVVHKYDCVVACFAGHAHVGGHHCDSRSIHHRVLEAVLECPPETDAFGRIEVYEDRLLLIGTDRMMTTEMVFSGET